MVPPVRCGELDEWGRGRAADGSFGPRLFQVQGPSSLGRQSLTKPCWGRYAEAAPPPIPGSGAGSHEPPMPPHSEHVLFKNGQEIKKRERRRKEKVLSNKRNKKKKEIEQRNERNQRTRVKSRLWIPNSFLFRPSSRRLRRHLHLGFGIFCPWGIPLWRPAILMLMSTTR